MSDWQSGKIPTPYIPISRVPIPPSQVFDYRQSYDARWKIKKISSNGACQGLSIFWVIKSANGDDFATWLGPPSNASTTHGQPGPKMGKEMDDIIRVMVQQQKIFDLPQKSRSLNMNWARDRIAKLDGLGDGSGSTKLRATGNLTLLQGASAKQIASEVTSTDGFVFFGFSMTATDQQPGWGHAVAAQVTTPTVNFFDPNYGQYHFEDLSDFHVWFEHTLMPQYGTTNPDTAEIQHFS
ncbi:YopT-type cysteine protease domain-containing protein [Roseococcus sp.]|uniref:YopT-type cysteine protease domain-containing protein n=1 Tax=Roseococcus sp. TaxID=2109646 RepID=UPI003BABCF90